MVSKTDQIWFILLVWDVVRLIGYAEIMKIAYLYVNIGTN